MNIEKAEVVLEKVEDAVQLSNQAVPKMHKLRMFTSLSNAFRSLLQFNVGLASEQLIDGVGLSSTMVANAADEQMQLIKAYLLEKIDYRSEIQMETQAHITVEQEKKQNESNDDDDEEEEACFWDEKEAMAFQQPMFPNEKVSALSQRNVDR